MTPSPVFDVGEGDDNTSKIEVSMLKWDLEKELIMKARLANKTKIYQSNVTMIMKNPIWENFQF